MSPFLMYIETDFNHFQITLKSPTNLRRNIIQKNLSYYTPSKNFSAFIP